MCSQVGGFANAHAICLETPILPLIFKRYWVLWGLHTWNPVFFSPSCLQRTSLFCKLHASYFWIFDVIDSPIFWRSSWFSIFLGFFLMKLIHQFSVWLQIVPSVVTLFGSLSCSLVRKGLVRKGESYWFFGWFFYTRPCWEACKISTVLGVKESE